MTMTTSTTASTATTATTTSTPTTSTAPSFAALGVPAPLVQALAAGGITAPFPIQTATLPDSLAGRDVLGRGRTGSGKTVAFALPVVSTLMGSSGSGPSRPRALVLAPTRELVSQIDATMAPLARAVGLSTATVFGGVKQGSQVSALRRGVDILIACPGRLEDLLGQGMLRLDAVQISVLDEADHMADLGFLPGVKRILDQTPARTQRLLFSATLDKAIDVLVRRYLTSPVTHSVDPVSAPVSAMTHHLLAVSTADKQDVVRELASGLGRTLLFTRTKHQAKKLAKQLTTAGVPTVDLHGNLAQNARERNLAAFSSGQVRVLAATDIAARGIHVDEVSLVVHVDPPTEHKAYLHRSGRTARAGAGGTVITVMTPEQERDVRQMTRAAGIRPTLTRATPDTPLLGELTGPKAPHVAPQPDHAPARPVSRQGRSGQAPSRQAGSRQAGSGRRGTGQGRARGRGR